MEDRYNRWNMMVQHYGILLFPTGTYGLPNDCWLGRGERGAPNTAYYLILICFTDTDGGSGQELCTDMSKLLQYRGGPETLKELSQPWEEGLERNSNRLTNRGTDLLLLFIFNQRYIQISETHTGQQSRSRGEIKKTVAMLNNGRYRGNSWQECVAAWAWGRPQGFFLHFRPRACLFIH